jgi:hypothetical protein
VIGQILTSGLFILKVICLGTQILCLKLSQMWQIGKVMKNNLQQKINKFDIPYVADVLSQQRLQHVSFHLDAV